MADPISRIRARITNLLHWIKLHVPPGARTILGLLLIVGGIFGFLPVLGFWMIPLGVAVVLTDVRPLIRAWHDRRLTRVMPGNRDLPENSMGPAKEESSDMRFSNRTTAGHALAQRLSAESLDAPLVLALPRGGVPVALEVATALNAPLDLVMVRKIGVPGQPELAAGAVVNGGDPVVVINQAIANAAGLDPQTLDRLAAEQMEEIGRRRQMYLAGREKRPIKGRTAIVVDDGIATGATIRAAVRAVRRQEPARLVLAVPVAAQDTLDSLREEVDDIFCEHVPDFFEAVGAHYRDFGQVSDDEVVDLLAKADRSLQD